MRKVIVNNIDVSSIKKELADKFLKSVRKDGIELRYTTDEANTFNRTWNVLNKLDKEHLQSFIKIDLDKNGKVLIKSKSIDKYIQEPSKHLVVQFDDKVLPILVSKDNMDEVLSRMLPEFRKRVKLLESADFKYSEVNKDMKEDIGLTEDELKFLKSSKLSTLKTLLVKKHTNGKRIFVYGTTNDDMKDALVKYLSKVKKLQLVNPYDKIKNVERINLIDGELKFTDTGITGITKGKDSSIYEKKNGETYKKRGVKVIKIGNKDLYILSRDSELKSKLTQLLPFIKDKDKDKVISNFKDTITTYKEKKVVDESSDDDVL